MFDVSIVIPTYKTGRYLTECLTSISDQNTSCCSFEIILILNGPKEPYYSEIESVLGSLVNMEAELIYTSTVGVSNARNIGINRSTGNYILFLDDDDFLSPNYLDQLFQSTTSNTIVCSNVKTYIENAPIKIGEDYLSRAYHNLKGRKKTLVNSRSFLSSSCAKMIPKDIIRERRFNPNFSISEDALFMFSVSDRIRNITLASEGAIYYRRIREDSSFRTKNSFKSEMKNTLKLIMAYGKIYSKNPMGYNFLLLISRQLASIKIFISRNF